MGSVFISYRSTDRSFVTHLAEDLRETGFDVWLDQWQISGRLPYWEEIQTAVDQCTHFVFVISPDSIQRDSGAMTELLHAIQLRPAKVIVPIICKPTPFNKIPMVIGPGKLQIYDFTVLPYDEGLQKVIHALRSELPTPASDTQKKLANAASSDKAASLPRWSRTAAIITLAVILIMGGFVAVNNFRLNLLTTTVAPTDDPRVATVLTDEAQTRIAQFPSQTSTTTPTPTDTLTETRIDPNDFAAQTFAARTDQAATTFAAYSKTPTPTVTLTPNYQQTAEFIVAATDAQATANVIAAYTKTPIPSSTITLTPTHTFTPSLVPILDETRGSTTWQPIMRTFDYNGYGVEMVLVPIGNFTMGDDNERAAAVPKHSQHIDAQFWIDRYEVTNEQFDTLDGIAANSGYWSQPLRPREQITWIEAKGFCEKRGGFLPTEAQWEWAARGPQNLRYPWGNNWDSTMTIGYRSDTDGTTTVGSVPAGASWVGALDMSGNVWEWTSSIDSPYPYEADDGRENPIAGAGKRIERGGAWLNDNILYFQLAYRASLDATKSGKHIGFRCARDFDQ